MVSQALFQESDQFPAQRLRFVGFLAVDLNPDIDSQRTRRKTEPDRLVYPEQILDQLVYF